MLRRKALGVLNRVLYPSHLRIEFSVYRPPWETDQRFRRICDLVEERSLIGPSGLYNLYQGLTVVQHVRGDVVEFGVYKGGSAGLLSRTLQALVPSKRLLLFDSFQGLPQAHPSFDSRSEVRGALRADEREVREFLKSLDAENYQIFPGWLSETFPRVIAPDLPLSLVHIHVDLYEPVKQALELTYNHLSPGGLVMVDDFGNLGTPGAARAVRDFASERGVQPFFLPINQGLIMKT